MHSRSHMVSNGGMVIETLIGKDMEGNNSRAL
jgi:hypothetical protein